MTSAESDVEEEKQREMLEKSYKILAYEIGSVWKREKSGKRRESRSETGRFLDPILGCSLWLYTEIGTSTRYSSTQKRVEAA